MRTADAGVSDRVVQAGVRGLTNSPMKTRRSFLSAHYAALELRKEIAVLVSKAIVEVGMRKTQTSGLCHKWIPVG